MSYYAIDFDPMPRSEDYVSPYLLRPLRSLAEVLAGKSGDAEGVSIPRHASAEADRPESGQVPGPHLRCSREKE